MKLQTLAEASHINQPNIPPELRGLIQFFEKVDDINYENGMGSNWKVKKGFRVKSYDNVTIVGLDLYPEGDNRFVDYTFVKDNLNEYSTSAKNLVVDKLERVYP